MARAFTLSLRNTLIAALAFAALLPLLIVGVYTRAVTQERIVREELHAVENRTLRLAQELGASLSVYLADLRTIERVPPLQGLMRARTHGGVDTLSGSTDLQWRHRLEQIFLGFADAKANYHALRFVDLSGTLLAGVEKQANETTLVSATASHRAANLSLARQTVALSPGNYFFTDALVPEFGPEKASAEIPIIRFAAPVSDPAGEPWGVVAIDIDAQWILDWLRKMESLEAVQLILADGAGRYLYRPDDDSLWGQQKSETGVAQAYPELWQQLENNAAFGLLRTNGAGAVVYSRVHFGADGYGAPWLLVSIPDPVTLGRTMDSIHGVLLVLFGVSLVVAIGLGYWFSAAWVVKPIDALLGAVRRFGRGELGARAMTFADNEIGRLAQSFNEMAHHHESAVERERAHAEQLRQAAHVFEYTRDGVVITDIDGNIVAVNKAFTEITGYSEAEALGRNPRMLKSHRHDEKFYVEMWRVLAREGHWQGEVWNRRKNGEVYPEWLTITRVEDEWDEPVNYVAVFSDISSHKREQERLSHLAHYDILTDLPNRLLFADRVRHSLHRAKRDGQRCAVLFLDLDKFKPVNDRYGHLVGDQVLQAVAWRLSRSLREEDTISRLGGDEFAVLLEQVRSRGDAEDVAKKLSDSLLEPFEIDGREIHVGVSVGISLYPEDGISFEALLRQADLAMYGIKMGRSEDGVASGGSSNN